jgi:hypothetical protein
MAVNTNKRIPIKHIRDKAKSAYEKKPHCYICNAQNELELHHLHSLTHLLEVWVKRKGYDISTDHVQLHGIYGKSPSPSSVTKQQHWIELQRNKHLSGESVFRGSSYGSYFAEFTGGLDGVRKNT